VRSFAGNDSSVENAVVFICHAVPRHGIQWRVPAQRSQHSPPKAGRSNPLETMHSFCPLRAVSLGDCLVASPSATLLALADEGIQGGVQDSIPPRN